ncbi:MULTISPECIES: DNA recombination protein RmuC [Acidocella]|uniref:DNA recombination protein RmuC n=1 Tax=Acidocella TaxID=50709 RepID=UPI00028F17A8|nr:MULTISPECIES: DNA recombination protein RmuC [Acidocella]EKM98607.1 rmuC family protein [Acidocella sp. MX-AZ02]WBO58926.1 DNA recombination protein RmuC [Acidocella sp. MX-AZ03]
MDTLLPALALLAALGALVFAVLAWRAALGAPPRLKLELDKLLAGNRAEAEFTRSALAAMEGRLTQAIQSGTTDALAKSFEQIAAATQNVAATIDGLRRQAGEEAQKTIQTIETRLAAIQTSVNEKLHEAVEQQMTASFARVLEQFAQVQQAMGEVQSAAKQVGDLKRLFSNVKTRGGWGEAQLAALLEQILPPGTYQPNFALKDTSRERVDFALRMPSRELLWLPIDAKFPTEDYDRLLTAADGADAEAERAARDGLALRIRGEARKIREKYICPPETVDFGVLYLPSDGLFAEVARIPGLIDDVRARERVIVLGPSLLPALLQTIHLGHVTLDLEKRAGEIGQILGATKTEMVKMDDALAKLAANASTMSNNIEKVRTRTRVMHRVLKTVEVVEAGSAQALLGLSEESED